MKIVDPACFIILLYCLRGIVRRKFLKFHDNFTRIGLRNGLHTFTLNIENENGPTVCADTAEQKKECAYESSEQQEKYRRRNVLRSCHWLEPGHHGRRSDGQYRSWNDDGRYAGHFRRSGSGRAEERQKIGGAKGRR